MKTFKIIEDVGYEPKVISEEAPVVNNDKPTDTELPVEDDEKED